MYSRNSSHETLKGSGFLTTTNMKITFYRKGHANNSSSSHSLVFTNEFKTIGNTEDSEFGWDFFTVSSLESKKNYILCCLRDSFFASIDLRWNCNADISYKMFEEFKENLFKSWINVYFSDFKFDLNIIDDSCVDHQSVFMFPTYRDKQRGINKELANSVIKEFLRSEYIVLGGNDNHDRSHHLSDLRESQTEFIKFWRFCIDTYKLNKAEYDIKTSEYVVSKDGYDGSLIKIKF